VKVLNIYMCVKFGWKSASGYIHFSIYETTCILLYYYSENTTAANAVLLYNVVGS